MGFGSYDESDQQAQDVNTEEDEGESVNVHENAHGGKTTFETDVSTNDLVENLEEIKTDRTEE